MASRHFHGAAEVLHIVQIVVCGCGDDDCVAIGAVTVRDEGVRSKKVEIGFRQQYCIQ